MNSKIMITVAILGLAGYWAWRKYVLFQNIQIQIASVTIDGGLLNPNFRVQLIVRNPTQSEATLTELTGLIEDKKKNKIATLSITDSYKIDPDSFILVPLDIKMNSFKVLESIADFYYNKTQDFNLIGIATVNNIPIPYQFNVTV
jgi:hypothetical protein